MFSPRAVSSLPSWAVTPIPSRGRPRHGQRPACLTSRPAGAGTRAERDTGRHRHGRAHRLGRPRGRGGRDLEWRGARGGGLVVDARAGLVARGLASPSTEPPSSEPPPAASRLHAVARPRRTADPTTGTVVAVQKQLQDRLDAARQRLGIPGVSATIIFRDGTTWTGTSGDADVARATEVTDDTAFAIGSVSKTYTAALILALARDGLIDVDAPAATYLAGLPLDPKITVRMLLNHTSGSTTTSSMPRSTGRCSRIAGRRGRSGGR